MRRVKRDLGMVLTGLALGAVLTGGAVAAGIVAEPSWQDIYVDGQQVQMTAYNINGNNYVKLRDIGKAVGFNVYWDMATNGVQIDSGSPYTGEVPTAAGTEAVYVGSVKGDTLKARDRSMLIIGPTGVEYTVSSSDAKIIGIENVSGYWVAVAKAPGTAVIAATDGAGKKGTLTLTVEATETDLSANMEIREEMVKLINEVRAENGVGSLSVSDALMNAAQDCSEQRFSHHNTEYEYTAALKYGYPHGFRDNLTWFSGALSLESIAAHAVENWVKSPGHFVAMIDPDCNCIGVGATIYNGTAYCYMFAGDPKAYNPYG